MSVTRTSKRRGPEQRYMDIVAQLPCLTCPAPDGPVELHHVREGQGMAQRAGPYCVIPLCPDCHRGPMGLHGNKTMMRVAKLDEMDMLNMTIGMVFRRCVLR